MNEEDRELTQEEEAKKPNKWEEIQKLFQDSVGFGKKAWVWLVLYPAVLVLILIIVGLAANVIGLKDLNVVLGICTIIVFILSALRPEFVGTMLAIGLTSGVLRSPQTIEGEIKKLFELYVKASKNILLYITLVFSLLAVFDFKENVKIFWLLILLVIVIALASEAWGIGGKLGKRIVYFIIAVTITVTTIQLIPDVAWNKVGFNPFNFLKSTETDIALANFSETQRKMEDAKNAKKIQQLKEKLARGETLEKEEAAFLAKVKGDRNILGLLGSSLSSMRSEKQEEPPKFALIQNQPNGLLEQFPIINSVRKDEARLLTVRIRMSETLTVNLIGITDGKNWKGTWSDKPKTIRGEFSMTSSDGGQHYTGTYDDPPNKKRGLKIEIFLN